MHRTIAFMFFAFGFLGLFRVVSLQYSQLERGEQKQLQYGNFKEFFRHMLNISQVLVSSYVKDQFSCAYKCLVNMACFSFNVAILADSSSGQRVCHLLASDKYNYSTRFVPSWDFDHYAIWSPCENFPCQSGRTCRPLYEKNSYVCDCPEGRSGTHCQTKISLASCKELYEKQGAKKSHVYTLMIGPQTIPVYCHMGNFGCGDGGWTLAMKIDGRNRTFHYDSAFWSDKKAHNLAGGKTGFDSQETKLPTYWNTSFSKICLGMKTGNQTKFLALQKQAQSLHALLADGKYRATSLGRNTWKALIGSQASLQTNCNMEGFNAAGSVKGSSKARIGILGNEGTCTNTDSRIGFGTGGLHDDSNTCGNYAIQDPSSDNGGQNIKAMGYILVQ